MPGARIGLDNPAFAGRLRSQSRRSLYERRAIVSPRRVISDIRPASVTAMAQKPRASLTYVVTTHRSTPKATPSRQARSTVLMRRLVAGKRHNNKGRLHFNPRSIVLSSLAGILFLFGLGVGFTQLHTNKEVKQQVQTLAAHTEASTQDGSQPENGLPSENKPEGSVSGYRAAPESPKVISIPKLDIKARVLRMGVKPNNEIKTPGNIYDAGWFEGSARPGEQGAVFINAHVHGPTKPGVFAGIKKLKAGDKIKIERGDGKAYTYSVVKSQIYDKDKVDMGATLNSIVPGKSGLNLMTCDGQYKTDGGYNKRVVVFAVQD